MKYSYAAEKFSVALHCLMLPHPDGEAESIMNAFNECSLGLENLDRDGIEEITLKNIEMLEELMNTEGLEDPSNKGLHLVKAEQLSIDDKLKLSRIVDDLAYWFDRASS